MYARAFELEPTNSFIQVQRHRFQDAEDVRSVNGVLAATEPQLVQINDARLSNPEQHTRHVQTTPDTQSRRNLQAPCSLGLECNKSHRTLAKFFNRRAYVAATATYTGPYRQTCYAYLKIANQLNLAHI